MSLQKTEVIPIKVSNGTFKNYCYLLISGKSAILIDPAWEYASIQKEITLRSVALKAILLTHSHIDHVHLAADFAVNFNVPVYMLREEIEFSKFTCPNLQPLVNMQDVPVENFKMKPIHTPGHTKGSACFLTDDAIFTGDTLFIEGCGECVGAGASAGELFKSIALLKAMLRDQVRVYPGHSFQAEPGQPVAYLKKNNIYYQISDMDRFIKFRMRSNGSIFTFR